MVNKQTYLNFVVFDSSVKLLTLTKNNYILQKVFKMKLMISVKRKLLKMKP